ncbi:FxsA family protein [Methylocapsa acidiphila]|uniref:FxsA family protein n=1 Tax=Methylocapsa acidiphila TaxID=133552 RepID=UPI0009FF4ED4|nr:FxsA family protein [Methylocapsa acidiphila]
MRLPTQLMLGFAIWLIAEIVVFGMIVEILSFSGAVLLCLMTSLAGAAMLRRLGLSAAFRLRKALANRSQEQAGLSREALLDGTLAGLGSILLILPGFVSDFIGLALTAPSIRFWVTERIRVGKYAAPPDGRRPAAPKVIDLAAKDWTRVEEPVSQRRRTPPDPA